MYAEWRMGDLGKYSQRNEYITYDTYADVRGTPVFYTDS